MFARECLEIAPACEERMLGREGLPLLGEAGIFLTGLSELREHYLIQRNCPAFHILLITLSSRSMQRISECWEP